MMEAGVNNGPSELGGRQRQGNTSSLARRMGAAQTGSVAESV